MEENDPSPDIHRRLWNITRGVSDSAGLADSVWMNVVFSILHCKRSNRNEAFEAHDP